MSERNYNIDVLKAIAIVSVILLHSLSTETLLEIGAPFHIWQAVPVFLILFGYNATKSYERRGFKTISTLYRPILIYNKIQKIIIPFLIVWVLQVLVHVILLDGIYISELLRSFFLGGYGPGSYFVPLIIQAILIMPLIYLLTKKSLIFGTIGLFVISIGLEFFSLSINISEGINRLLLIRYVFALTLGSWLALNKKSVYQIWLFLFSIFSLIYIIGVNYLGYTFIMGDYWGSQHVFSYFYTLSLIILGLNLYHFKLNNIVSKWLVLIGEASYHIFLVQMVYFWTLVNVFSNFTELLVSILNLFIFLAFGLLFYKTDYTIRKVINKNLNRKSIVIKN